MAERILRLPAVKDRTGLSRSSVYEKIATGDFPKPISLGARAVAGLNRTSMRGSIIESL